MIEARKNRLIERLFRLQNRRMLRRAFHAIHIEHSERVAALDRKRPIILYGNHSNWWDGLIAFHLSTEIFHLDSFLMMEEEQMVKYAFFRWIGAFSVNRRSPREAWRSVNYAASLFDRPNRALWLYPQGILLPNELRPLRFESGLLRLIGALPAAQIVPIAMRYSFGLQQTPEVFISPGEPAPPPEGSPSRAHLDDLAELLTGRLDRLSRRVTERDFEGFRTILLGRLSANTRYDTIKERMQ